MITSCFSSPTASEICSNVSEEWKTCIVYSRVVGKSKDPVNCNNRRYTGLVHKTHFWQQEIEQSPELVQVVLQGSTRDEQTTLGVVKPNDLREH